jgi:hypothetical protein
MNKLKILCIYCKKPWDAKMKLDYNITTTCDTCGTSGEFFVEVYCSNCKKLVYKKETDFCV